MDVIGSFKFIGISLLLASALAACDAAPGPAESAGKKIDQSANEAGKKLGEALDKVGKKIDEQGEKAAVAVDDAEITTRVKAAIFAEPGLKTLQIRVATVNGAVTLSGSVDTPQNGDRAAALAAAVSGVSGVDNRLVPMAN